MKASPSQTLLDQAKLELEARHPQSVRLPASRHTKLRDGRIVSDMQLASAGIISLSRAITEGTIRARNMDNLFGRKP